MESYTLINATLPSPLLLSAEHAGNLWPAELPQPDWPQDWQNQHYASDRGTAGLAPLLAERLNCPLLMGRYTRLLVDLNRLESDADLIAASMDGITLTGNVLDETAKAERIARYYTPYHTQLAALRAKAQLHVSIHSYTRQRASDAARRPWDAGILYTRPSALSAQLLKELAQTPYCIGDNQPYNILGEACVISQSAQGVEIEICDDLLQNKNQQVLWANLLADVLSRCRAEVSSPACG